MPWCCRQLCYSLYILVILVLFLVVQVHVAIHRWPCLFVDILDCFLLGSDSCFMCITGCCGGVGLRIDSLYLSCLLLFISFLHRAICFEITLYILSVPLSSHLFQFSDVFILQFTDISTHFAKLWKCVMDGGGIRDEDGTIHWEVQNLAWIDSTHDMVIRHCWLELLPIVFAKKVVILEGRLAEGRVSFFCVLCSTSSIAPRITSKASWSQTFISPKIPVLCMYPAME